MGAGIVRLGVLLALAAVPAAAVETETLFDGKDVGAWDTARDGARLEKEFSLSEVAALADPPALRWRFVPKDVGFNDLFLRCETERRFLSIRALVRCLGEPFTLCAKVRGSDAAEWAANQIPLQRSDKWRWVEFPWDEWKVASWSRDADGKLDFPLMSFTLIAFGVRTGAEYHLQVQRVEVVRADPPLVTLHEFALPSKLRAGTRATARISFTLDRPCTEEQAQLVFRRGKSTVLRVPIALPAPLPQIAPGKRVTLPAVPVEVPEYAFGGQQEVALVLGEARVRGDEGRRPVTITQRQTQKTMAQVRPHNGVPTLFINGKPHNGMAWASYVPSVEVFTDFAEAGVDLFTFSATPTEAGYGLSKTTWTAPDDYDYSQLDERVMMVMQANPTAYFFPRLYLHAPKWWSEQHPDDIVLMDPGDGKPVPFIHSGGKPAPSWASEAWRRDTIEGLRRLIAHVEASPYADRVVGYHIASGTTEEWMMWGGNENQWVDYSPANTKRFRRWLKEKYATDAALRTAWGRPEVRIETATVPTKKERQETHLGSLRDPAKEQAAIDYYLYNSDLVAETIAVFTGAVKEATRREKLAGVFYGYLLQLCGEQRQQNAGHLALAQVLACPDLDFITSPTSYAFRQLGGEGTSHFMSLLDSIKLHGKLWFDENDIRTSLSGGKVGEWGRPADIEGDLLQQEKELANCIVNGAAQWWFDVGGNKYNDQKLMGRIGELAVNAGQALPLDRSPADEVALVVDERSLTYLRVADPLGRFLLLGQLPELHRLGAPVGHYLVTDLPRLGDRKLFLIPTSFAPTEADRKAIDALKRDGHVLVFLWAPGYYRDGKPDEAAMEALTGIRLRASNEPAAFQVTLKEGHPLTEGLAGQTYGNPHQGYPIVIADDPEAKVLGTLADGRPGLVVKEHAGWAAVHSSAPLLPASLLRRLAARAGVHSYIGTDDVVWASRDLVAVSVKQGGKRTVRLPRKASVRDLYTGKPVASGVDAFEAEFPERGTRVFVLGR